jgi:similar to spore coat protein
MGNIIQNIAGVSNMTDEIISYDFLLATKSGIKMYTDALTETVNPKIREVLNKHLHDILYSHEKIVNYMVEKGYYYPKDMDKQITKDLEAIEKFASIE